MTTYKDDLVYKIRDKIEMERRYKHAYFEISSDEEENFISESQDFCLKLTQDSIESDAQKVVTCDNRDIIIISDSTSDCDSPKQSTDIKLKSVKHFNLKHEKCIESSSNSESLDAEEEYMFESWRKNKKIDFFNNKKKGTALAKRSNILLTSDSTTPSSSDTNDKCIDSSPKTKSTYINLTPEKNKRVIALSGGGDSYEKRIVSSTKSTYISFTPDSNKRVTALSGNGDSNGKSTGSSTKSTYISFTPDSNKRVTALSGNGDSNGKSTGSSTKSTYINFTPESNKNKSNNVHGKNSAGRSIDKPQKALSSKSQTEIKKKLTRGDMRNILKNISSPKVAYDSPRRNNNIVINESIDNNVIVDESMENGVHPAISFRSNLIESTKIIDETPPSSSSDNAPYSKSTTNNLHRNHVNEILNNPKVDKLDQIVNAVSELSERKKKQISEWLQTNSPDSKSDSSFSMVPASNRSGVSSGNSSLERLEMNYETPNNRDRIRQARTSEKKATNEEIDQIVQTSATRQTTILDYTKRSKNDALELRTPTNRHTDNVMLAPTINKPQNIDVMGCADILDKLYGTSWRKKADELLPQSEPRKRAVGTKSRAVQTERKARTKKICSSESADEDSSASLEDLRPQKPSTKKNARVVPRQKDSFINDGVSSGSGCESSYYTAVTNPRASTKNVQPKPTVPPRVQRALRICDTDSEDDGRNEENDDMLDMRRKKLYFIDDESESESSSTSEFDPGDDVPPKPVVKKDPPKPPRQTVKKSSAVKSISDNRKCEKKYSFLASLSENVPIASAHADAKIYRTNFKNNKETLCNYLYKLYNERVFDEQLPKDMSIEWNVRMRGTAGFCYNKKSVKTLGGVVRSSRIVLSTKVLDTPDRLRDTLIHEMCHAAAWLINSVSDGHGPFWTGWAKKAMMTFPDLPPIRRCHDYKIKTKFTYKCVGCGYSIGRHSKSLDVERKRCGHCYGKFELLINKTTKSGTVQVQTPKRELGGFALFVKENYSSVKKDRNVKHAEIMKILGQQFSTFKIANNQGNVENDPDTPG